MSDLETAKQLFFEALALLDAQDHVGAESRLRRALDFAPRSVSILSNLSVALLQQGKTQEALSFATRATDIDARNVEALLVMANCYAGALNFAASLATCDRILALESRLADIHSNRGVALNGLHRYAEALASCDQAIALQPNSASAHNNRGNALVQLHRPDEALMAYEHALRFNPALAEAWAGRGHALARRKQHDDALAALARAIELKPNLASAWSGRGDVLMKRRQLDDALSAYTQAIECNAALAGGWLGRGNVLSQLARFDDAIAAYDRALDLDPILADALKERGGAYVRLGRFTEAFADFDKAYAINPGLHYLEGERLHAKMNICDWLGFDAECAHLLSSIASGHRATVPFPVLAIPSSPQDQRKCAELFTTDQLHPGAGLWRGERYDHRRIRVAYLSPDFRVHPLSQLAKRLFEHHDRSRFEITAISFGPDDGSELRRRLMQSFDHFIDIRDRSDRSAAELIRETEIDIAVDLCGHTQHSRLNILAQRPAPVQATYLGYPGTTGAPHIDYLVADRVLIRPEHRAGYSEKIVYLPDSYQVNDRERATAPVIPTRGELGLPETGFVFCCFNNAFKITPDVFDIWIRLLHEVDGSVLWLLAGYPRAMDNLRREAGARGVSPDRLVFAPRLKLDLHLARHSQADLFVDTFHCGAHTTASDALWAGLPVLTHCGSTFASRVGASLLQSLGLTELIVSSAAEYHVRALRFVREPSMLAELREKLRARRDTCALFDTARFTRHLEAAYQVMWERAQRGDPAHDFAVDPID